VAVYSVAEQLADLMETMLDPGNLESDMTIVAKATYHKSDTEGLTGLTYNLVVEILCRYWVYRKALNQALALTVMNKVEDINYKATENGKSSHSPFTKENYGATHAETTCASIAPSPFSPTCKCQQFGRVELQV
jgi:hypothetical protein